MSSPPFKVLVIGDIMCDSYVYVKTERDAPEAPIPVWDSITSEVRLGGAANVAANICSLGKQEVQVYLAGIIGQSSIALQLLRQMGVNSDLSIGGHGMTKMRYVDSESKKIIFRVDKPRSFDPEDVKFMNRLARNYFLNMQFDAIVISDYDKGTVTTDMISLVKERWPKSLKVVDSKRADLGLFEGFDVLKVNEHEYGRQCFLCSTNGHVNVERLFGSCVVTKGKAGAELRIHERIKSGDRRYVVHTENFPTRSVPIVDVTGCGDTHTAAMTYMMLKSGDIRTSIRYANDCASSVVQRFGTSVA